MQEINRRILVAVDESENAKRAVHYVAELLKGIPGFNVIIINIILIPPDDYFVNANERLKWQKEHQKAGEAILEKCAKIFEKTGFEGSSIKKILLMKPSGSIGDYILEEQSRLGCSTVVIGRRGISKKEEFIFGSTSNKILHSPKNCTVWIVE